MHIASWPVDSPTAAATTVCLEATPGTAASAWLKEMVVSGKEVLERLLSRFDLQPIAPDNPSSTSKRWAFPNGRGEIGIIAPVVLGGGKRLFEGFSQSLDLEHLGVRQSQLATFIDYRLKPS